MKNLKETELKDDINDIEIVNKTIPEWKKYCSNSLSKAKGKVCGHKDAIEGKVKEKPISALIAAFTVGLISSMILTKRKKK